MKSNLKLSAILMCLALAGCMETGQQLTEIESSKISLASDEFDPNARKGDGGGTTGQIYLTVTVDDLMISSDGLGDYTNGKDGVSAQFQSPDGILSFTTSPTRRNAVSRSLKFPTNIPPYEIPLNGYSSYLVNVLAPDNSSGLKKIQDMLVGENQLMAMRVWGSNSSGVEFRLLFKLGTGLGYVTDAVKVTRFENDTWTVESTSTATAALTGPLNSDLKDYYSVPFKFIFKKIN